MAREVNDGKPNYVLARVQHHADRFKDPVIACLGLSYKANVDDLREGPPVEIAAELGRRKVGRILVVEPHIVCLPPALHGIDTLEFCTMGAALERADIAVLLVDHSAFRGIKAEQLLNRIVIDTRGFWRDRLTIAEA